MPKKFLILHVEDNPDQAELVRDYLRINGGHEVVWAKDIQDFWEHVFQRAFDIILMDYRLPDGTGLNLLSEMADRRLKLPVIMITGQGDEAIAAQAIQLGAADYIVKKPDFILTLPSVLQKTISNFLLQKEIQQSMEKVRYQAFILNNVHDAVVVWDRLGIITFWNRSAESLFGLKEEEVMGTFVKDCYLPLYDPIPELETMTAFEEEIEQDRVLKRKDGSRVWINSKTTMLMDEHDIHLSTGFMEISRDITDRKRMEAEIKVAQLHLIEAARLAAIGELASGVAHRVYNPLASIIANAHLLKQYNLEPQVLNEAAEDIQKSGWQAQQIVRQLLEFSKPASETFEIIVVSDTIKQAIGLVGGQIQAKQIEIIFILDDKHFPTVNGNGRQLENLWVNLLLLAADATYNNVGHKFIQISITQIDELVIIEVYDNAQPIPEELLPKIFEPNFIEADSGRGSGLELSICREIVHQHRGSISIVSDQHGTKCIVEMPAHTINTIKKI
jgi:two-component system, cell cycle sensor histidine kinase and response regulator CckA